MIAETAEWNHVGRLRELIGVLEEVGQRA